MYYLGVDPGVNGGLVELGCALNVVRADKMPEDDAGIWSWVSDVSSPVTAVLESIPPAVGYKTKNKAGEDQASSKSSMSKLYGSYRALRMALVIAGITVLEVRLGEVWRAFGISPKTAQETKSQWKGRIKAEAQKVFPQLKVTLAISDALLFAEYGRRKGEGIWVTKITPKTEGSEIEL